MPEAPGEGDRPACEVYALEVVPPRGPRWLVGPRVAYSAVVGATALAGILPDANLCRYRLRRRDDGAVALDVGSGGPYEAEPLKHRLEQDLATLTAAQLEQQWNVRAPR